MDPVRGMIHLGLKLTETTLDRALDVIRLADTLLVSTAASSQRERSADEQAWPDEEQADLDALSATLRARKAVSEGGDAKVSTAPERRTPPRRKPAPARQGGVTKATPARKGAASAKRATPGKKAAATKTAKKATPVKKAAATKTAKKATPVKKTGAAKTSPQTKKAASAKKSTVREANLRKTAPAGQTAQQPETPTLIVLPDA